MKAVIIQRIGERRISLIIVILLWGQSKSTTNKDRNLWEESWKRKLPSYYLIEIGAFSGVNYAEFHLKAFLKRDAMLRVERNAGPRYKKRKSPACLGFSYFIVIGWSKSNLSSVNQNWRKEIPPSFGGTLPRYKKGWFWKVSASFFSWPCFEPTISYLCKQIKHRMRKHTTTFLLPANKLWDSFDNLLLRL